MFFKRIIPLLVILLIATTKVQAETERFQINVAASENLQTLAAYTRQIVQEAISEFEPYLGTPTGSLNFLIVSSADEMRRELGALPPYWSAAVTIFPEGRVILKSPTMAHTTLRRFRGSIQHELVHLLHGRQVPLNLFPNWFTEGLAVYLTDEFDLAKRVVLSRAVARKRLIPLERLDEMLRMDHVNAQLAYSQAASAIEFLVQVYGPAVIRQILQSMQENKDFEKSLALVIGIGFADFPYYWQSYLGKHYRWIFLLDIQHILWYLMPLLLIFAYLVVRRRNARRLQDMEEMEMLEDENSDQDY